MTINLTMPLWCPPLPRELPIRIVCVKAINLVQVNINNQVTDFIRDFEGQFKSEYTNHVDACYLRCIESQLNRMFG